MTTIDHARLRALAEAATPGPWKAGSAWVYTDPVYPDDNRLYNVFGMDFADNVRQEAEHQRGVANADYVAAIDPPTLIALLDRLEAATSYVADPGNWSAMDGRRRLLLAILNGEDPR